MAPSAPSETETGLGELGASWHSAVTQRTSASLAADASAGATQPATQRQRFSSGLPHPIYIASGAGAYFDDLDGNRYLDLTAGWNSAILGRANPAISEAVYEAMKRAGAPGSAMHPSLARDRLAETLCSLVPSAERVIFAPSGSEANAFAVRFARAFTGRNRVMRMEGGYHGQYDYLVGGDSPSLGLPEHVSQDVISVPFNDIEACKEALSGNADSLAAVFVEPLMTIPGAIHQRDDFLDQLRTAALDAGVPFVLDEVITGMRFGRGGASRHYKFTVPPDLVVMGKMLGGGLPVAAVVGSAEILEAKVSASNTHAQNEVCLSAALAMIDQVADADFMRLHAQGERLRAGLRSIGGQLSIPIAVTGDGPCVGLHFTNEDVVDYATAKQADQRMWRIMCTGMALAGFSLSSRTFGPILPFVDEDIDATLKAFQRTLTAMDEASVGG
jgi:glutamate-1-semialdehyde 2,1-aminomutase